MTVRTSAGSSIAISASAPATFNEAGYAALTYADIGEVSNMGEFSRVYQLVTWNPLSTRGTKKMKGSFNDGAMTLQLGLDNTDAGQAIAKAALDDDEPYSFEVTLQDGSVYYFQALVMGFPINIGDVNTVTSASITLEITTADDGTGIVGPV